VFQGFVGVANLVRAAPIGVLAKNQLALFLKKGLLLIYSRICVNASLRSALRWATPCQR